MHSVTRLALTSALAAVLGCSAAETREVVRAPEPAPPVEDTARRAHEELERMARSLGDPAVTPPSDVGAARSQLEEAVEKLAE
jgi:hypothetical protein